MAWRTAPDALVAYFETVLPDDPGVERRKMFGYPAAFVGGKLFASLFQDDLILRLPPDACAQAMQELAARPFAPMPGRTMRGYVAIAGAPGRDAAVLRPWLMRAFAHARSLPAKPRATPQRARKTQ